MTVPHDAVLCLGLGVAAHLSVTEGRPLSPAARRIATEGFALAWLPMTSALLWLWTDWSWWYWEPVLGSKAFAFAAGIALECGAFAAALLTAGHLSPAGRRWTLVGVGVYEGLMLTLPWSHFATVGTLDEVQAGLAPSLFESWGLMATIAGGGLWLGAIGLWTARRLWLSSSSDP